MRENHARARRWMAGFAWITMTTLAVPTARAEEGAQIWGIELGTGDIAASVAFYERLGFEVLRSESDGAWTLLRSGAIGLVLSATDREPTVRNGARVYLNLSVGDLAEAARAVAEGGGTVEPGPPAETPVGQALRATDPAGHPLNLIDHPGDALDATSSLRIFNLGMTVPDVSAEERFFDGLGIGVASRAYLPDTLVLERRGSTYLVLHSRDPALPARSEVLPPDGGRLLLSVPSLGPILARARQAGLAHSGSRMPAGGLGRGSLALRSPSGVEVEVARRPPIGPEAEARARAAFDRIKSLAGRWRAESTVGWNEEMTYEVAARGSAVIGRVHFAAAPERSMATFFVLDGTRLLVTHICEARNQPRFEATSISADASEIELTFLDGTTLPSRDRGHMDSAIIRFHGQDHFSSAWSWYQDGKERLMEEITYTRIDDSPEAEGGGAPTVPGAR